MNFNHAIQQMKMGNCVKRNGWEDGYCCLMPDMAYLWRIITKPQANAGNFLPTLSDIEAEDWLIHTKAQEAMIEDKPIAA
jgi:uncharacterized protein DUF2829